MRNRKGYAMNRMATIASWSGGKDSCLACYKAIKGGHDIRYLLNFVSRKYNRCCFHGIEAGILKRQVEAIGIPLIQKAVSDDMKKYEDEFKAAVSEIKAKGIQAMVFGDIYLDEHKDWVDRVCNDLGISPIEPLWNVPAVNVVEEFIGLGFKAIIVSCKADLFGKEFVGRYIDKELIEELKNRNVCPC